LSTPPKPPRSPNIKKIKGPMTSIQTKTILEEIKEEQDCISEVPSISDREFKP